jgi:proteasome lid subunit RPN8/RPN11
VVTDGAGLTIPRAVADQMLAHARGELPNEACGILGGTLVGGDAGSADTYHPARNAEASPLRYSVHDDDLRRIVFAIDDAGRDLVAIFHSHTRSPAVPSATDRRAAMYPGAFHVLASLADPAADAQRALRAWRIVRGHAYEVPLRIGP